MLIGNMLVLKRKREDQPKHKCITCEAEPDALPVARKHYVGSLFVNGEVIDNPSADESAKEGSKPVRHQHKQSLRTCTNAERSNLLYEQRTRDVEEVEGHSVHDH